MKNTFFILLLLSISLTGYSQQGYYDENLNSNVYTASQVIGNPTPQPPDVAAFQKVNFVPVSNYTGRANISIPIYQITEGAMSVPISLTYNSSGVKVNDMASNVGLNWSLNAGGMISKMTKGMDDFHRLEKNGSTPTANDMSPSGWLSYTNVTNYFGSVSPYNDAEPDLFSANAPGLTTTYVYKSPYFTNGYGNIDVSTSFPDAVELEHQGNIINVTEFESYSGGMSGLSGFGNTDITSTNGIRYSFGSKETSKHYSAFKSRYTTGGAGPRAIVSSYRLDKMFDHSTNQTIDFEYEEYSVDFYDEIIQKGATYNGGTNISFVSNGASRTIYPTLQRLKRIVFHKGSVEFIYGLNRLDNIDEKALTEIKVKDNYGKTIKHIKLSYSYFQSSINSSTPQSKRLRLDRVYEIDKDLNELPGHVFEYNTSYLMPPRDSYAHDFLGYNNGSYNASITTPMPKYYLHYSNSLFNKYIRLSPFYNSYAVALPGNFSLEANENFAKTYTLKKITFPTGGYNEYEYELNEFSNYGTRKGGGLRIKSQTLNDAKGNIQILDYEYESGNIQGFPVFGLFIGSLPDNGATFSQVTMGIDTFLSPQSQVEFTQGAFVGYRTVKVKDRINNGYTNYIYSASGSGTYYNNIKPTITYNQSHSASVNWEVITTPSLSVDRDFLRGKVLAELVYNKDNEIRLEKTYNYTQKEFSNIHLKYLNRSSSAPLDNCYYDNGVYKLNQNNCGGFWEEIDMPVARDLLTTVVTKDYQAGNIVDTRGGPENIPYTFTTTQTYFHDKQYPLVTNESKSVVVCDVSDYEDEQNCQNVYDDYTNTNFSKEVVYPIEGGSTMQSNEISTLPYANELVQQNRLATPFNIKYNGVSLNEEKYQYKSFDHNIIALEKIDFKARDASITLSDKVTKRDAKGRVIEYQKPNGIYVARIYGYEYLDYLVAEVVNSTYDDASYTLKNRLATPFNQGTFSEDWSIRDLMSELRVALPDTQITSYTYELLVGVNSITDVRGQTVYYHYDSFNRLERITDVDGKVISKNKYHYKNQ